MQTGKSGQTSSANSTLSADFDFGHARGVTKQAAPHPLLVAGVIAFAFLLSMVIPTASRAETAKGGPTLTMPLFNYAQPVDFREHGRHRGPKDDKDSPRRMVPAVCALEIDGGRGGQTWYSGNCMRESGVRADLPRGCASSARIFGTRDRLYSPKCLRDSGLILPGRRG